MKMNITATATMQIATAKLASVVFAPQDDDAEFGVRVTPPELRGWLARLRLLQAVPFSYLVADAQLLPKESIRFFYLDRAWTDALVQGALSVGTVNSSDRAELAALYKVVRDELDEEERRVRLPGGETVQQGPAGPVTGFVLRSRAVSGWPGLHVRAYDRELGVADDAAIPESDPRRIKLLRMERLAPAVLFVLFDGVPAVVHLEEPRSGIQFGVRLDASASPDQQTAVVTVRDVKHPNNGPVKVGGKPRTVPVPFRAGSPGVINMKKLNEALINAPGSNMGGIVDAAEYAMQMLRFPLRQVFGDTAVAPGADSFVATLRIADMAERFELAARVLQ